MIAFAQPVTAISVSHFYAETSDIHSDCCGSVSSRGFSSVLSMQFSSFFFIQTFLKKLTFTILHTRWRLGSRWRTPFLESIALRATSPDVGDQRFLHSLLYVRRLHMMKLH